MEFIRKCIACGEEIKECMGFVLARDIVNKRTPLREICGKCGLKILDMNEEQLERWLSGLKQRFAKSSSVTAP